MEKKILQLGPWGYNMSINNFYEVIRETPKGAVVREIGSKTLEHCQGYLSGYEVPDPTNVLTETDWGIDGEFTEENPRPRKEKVYRVLKEDGEYGDYKGTCGLSRTHSLRIVKPGDKFYYNHCD